MPMVVEDAKTVSNHLVRIIDRRYTDILLLLSYRLSRFPILTLAFLVHSFPLNLTSPLSQYHSLHAYMFSYSFNGF
jgi:hypothetical protein